MNAGRRKPGELKPVTPQFPEVSPQPRRASQEATGNKPSTVVPDQVKTSDDSPSPPNGSDSRPASNKGRSNKSASRAASASKRNHPYMQPAVPPTVKAVFESVLNGNPSLRNLGQTVCYLLAEHEQQLRERAPQAIPTDSPFASKGEVRRQRPRNGEVTVPLSLSLEDSQSDAIASLLKDLNMSLPLLLEDLAEIVSPNLNR